MQYLCICHLPENSDLFKGHRLASPGGAYRLSYSVCVWGGYPKWGINPRHKGVQMCEEIMDLVVNGCF